MTMNRRQFGAQGERLSCSIVVVIASSAEHMLPGVSTVHAGVAVSLNSTHQGRQDSELHSTAIRHRPCWTWSFSVTLVAVCIHGPSPRTGPPVHACLGCLACTRSGHQQTLDAVMLCAHELPPPLSPHRGVYQARHNWGRYTVLFPTKDAGAGVRRSKSKASLDVPKQRAAVTNGALVSGCKAWVRDDPGALSQRLHPDTWFRARRPRRCWSAVEATGTQRTCRAHAHWASSRRVRAPANVGQRLRASGPVASPSSWRPFAGKRAPGFYQRPGWGTNAGRPRC
jgi:hypothetical protein